MTPATISKTDKTRLQELLKATARRQDEMVTTLQKLVEMESPSSDKAAVDLLGVEIAGRFAALGGKVTVHAQPLYGDHLQIDFPGGT